MVQRSPELIFWTKWKIYNSGWKWTRDLRVLKGQRRIDVKTYGYLDSQADQISAYIILILWEEWVELV